MRKEWIEQSKHGLAYCVSDGDCEMHIPISWKDAEDFLVDLNKAAQAAYGMDVQSAIKEGKDSTDKFHAAWLDILKDKMRNKNDQRT